MKKMMIALMALLNIAATGKAMSYEQARNEALFLTDKMAYELNLTQEQYEAAYEINLDYLMGVTSYDDVYGDYWERRNLDMSYILLDWQLNAFRAATYFFRPLYWSNGYWHFGIYARYPHRDYFYFGRPAFYASYRGGHAWHVNGGRSWYYNRRSHFVPGPGAGRSHFGMRDGWNRGDFRNSHHNGRISSTRTTVNNGTHHRTDNVYMNRDNNRERSGNGNWNRGSNNGGNGRTVTPTNPNNNNGSRSLGGYRSRTTTTGGTQSSGSFGGSRSRTTTTGGSTSSGSFGGSRSSSSHSSGSFSGGHSSTRSSGSGSGRSGGRSYGGHR